MSQTKLNQFVTAGCCNSKHTVNKNEVFNDKVKSHLGVLATNSNQSNNCFTNGTKMLPLLIYHRNINLWIYCERCK